MKNKLLSFPYLIVKAFLFLIFQKKESQNKLGEVNIPWILYG